MKANELMIGDWAFHGKYGNVIIESIDNDFGDSPSVMVISENIKHIKHKEGYTYGYKWCALEDIFPIPLTPEILEKNGFEKTQIHGEKQDDIFQCFVGEIIIEVGIYDPNFILIHYRYETPDGINSGELSSIVKVDGGKFYLHELQHALRLCGIEKEIKL